MTLRIFIGALLALSLGANAFLAGWMLSAQSRPEVTQVRGERGERGRPLHKLMRELRELPEEQREAALAVMREYRPQLRVRGRALREAREDMRDLLISEDYTREQAEARFAAVREASTAMQALAQVMILDLADRLPAETRAELLHKLGPPR